MDNMTHKHIRRKTNKGSCILLSDKQKPLFNVILFFIW